MADYHKTSNHKISIGELMGVEEKNLTRHCSGSGRAWQEELS
jgi:hypothetical protein